MIKVGDLVKHDEWGETRFGIVTEIDESHRVWCHWRDTIEEANRATGTQEQKSNTTLINVTLVNKGGNKMRKCITNVFKKTDDAVLVDEQFNSTEIKDDFITGLLVEQNKTAILAEAKRRATPVKETGED